MTPDEIRGLARLAHLHLEDAEVEAMRLELEGILGHLELLSEVETDEEPEPVVEHDAPLREDGGVPEEMSRRPIDAAPERRDGYVLVPPVPAARSLDRPAS
jgi:aspartyl-tRNA(Asn)/glutamyl-tRNA(Gln) amidotransferase subunit C